MEVKVLTSTQIQYWNLQESKLHDRNTESIQKQQADASTVQAAAATVQAAASKSQAETAAKQATTDRLRYKKVDKPNAKSNRINANANKKNATSNAKNAKTNRINAEINARNADTNARNADTNAMNANTNRLRQQQDAKKINAEIKKINADTAITKKDLKNYNKNKVLQYGSGKFKDIAATDYLAQIASDPNASSGIKQWAQKAYDLAKQAKTTKGKQKVSDWLNNHLVGKNSKHMFAVIDNKIQYVTKDGSSGGK